MRKSNETDKKVIIINSQQLFFPIDIKGQTWTSSCRLHGVYQRTCYQEVLLGRHQCPIPHPSPLTSHHPLLQMGQPGGLWEWQKFRAEALTPLLAEEERVAVTRIVTLATPSTRVMGKGMLYQEELLITCHGIRTQDKLIGQLDFLPVRSH